MRDWLSLTPSSLAYLNDMTVCLISIWSFIYSFSLTKWWGKEISFSYLARVLVTCRDCTKNKTTGSGNESCVWRTHPGYQKRERELNESRKTKENGINMWSVWSVKMFYSLFVDSWNRGNILATPQGRTSILKSVARYLLSREAEMVRIGTKEIVSGAVWTRGFAVEETSGDRKQSDAYGRTLQYWVLWQGSTFASCLVFGEVDELICSVGSLLPALGYLCSAWK